MEQNVNIFHVNFKCNPCIFVMSVHPFHPNWFSNFHQSIVPQQNRNEPLQTSFYIYLGPIAMRLKTSHKIYISSVITKRHSGLPQFHKIENNTFLNCQWQGSVACGNDSRQPAEPAHAQTDDFKLLSNVMILLCFFFFLLYLLKIYRFSQCCFHFILVVCFLPLTIRVLKFFCALKLLQTLSCFEIQVCRNCERRKSVLSYTMQINPDHIHN